MLPVILLGGRALSTRSQEGMQCVEIASRCDFWR